MEGTYKRHFISHFDSRHFACEICNQSNRDANEARIHLRQHSERKCTICPEEKKIEFTNSHVLNEHMKMQHALVSSMFNCIFCHAKIPLSQPDLIEEHLASHSRLENDNELENLLRQRLNETNEDEIKEEYIEAE
jgi:hypothetical protein